jgi:hypothetical protein
MPFRTAINFVTCSKYKGCSLDVLYIHSLSMTVKSCTHNSENGAYKQSSMEKRRRVALDMIFALLHMDLDLDLEKHNQIMEKREDWGIESENQPLAVPPFNKSMIKTSPPRKWPLLGFWGQNPKKWRRSHGEEGWVRDIYSPDLTEAVIVMKPPRLIPS